MTKKDLAKIMANKTNRTVKESVSSVDAFIDALSDTLLSGKQVYIRGFGTFGTAKRKAKAGRDIKNRQPIIIPAHTALTFKPCKELKEKIAKIMKP